ncbi:EpsG family protein [Xenorhabdus bovienii]|uniref:EpsG family protein n=1 Tax=Xenorhabdus bovienii TaxID=40576 RepID=UPI003B987352|nr:EpsG family protein [Xenorhabdus bovienii]
MIYLITNFFCLIYFYLYDYYFKKHSTRFFISIGVVFFLALLPAFQYGVGTDYFSYEDIFNTPLILEHYYKNDEYAFYYLVKIIYSIGFNAKSFFVIVSLIQSILILSIFNILKKMGMFLPVVFFCFFTITNLMHTQMNLIRASFSIYLFITAILLRFNKENLYSFICIIIAILFHKSAAAVALFLLLPNRFYLFCYKHILLIYLFSLIIFIINPFREIIYYFIQNFLPFYSPYLNSGIINSNSISIINTFTKLYYLPIHIVFILLVLQKKITLNKYEKIISGFWVLISNIYILTLHYDFFSRINYFFVFFYLFPALFTLNYFMKKKSIYFILTLLYILSAYVIKVCLFPVAEFTYHTYII